MPGHLPRGGQEQTYIAWGCDVIKLLFPGSADPQGAGQCGSASVRNEPAMFPSVGLEWVSMDASSKSVPHTLSFNPGGNTHQAMLSAHRSHGRVALKGSAEDLGLEEKAAPEAGPGLGSSDPLCRRLGPFRIVVLRYEVLGLQGGVLLGWQPEETPLECEQNWCLKGKDMSLTVCVRACVCTCVYTCVHVCTCVGTCVYMCVCIHACHSLKKENHSTELPHCRG